MRPETEKDRLFDGHTMLGGGKLVTGLLKPNIDWREEEAFVHHFFYTRVGRNLRDRFYKHYFR